MTSTHTRPSIPLAAGDSINLTTGATHRANLAPRNPNPTISYTRTTPRRRAAAPSAPPLPAVLSAPLGHAVGVALSLGDAVEDNGTAVILDRTVSGRSIAHDMRADGHSVVRAITPTGVCELTIAAGETYPVRFARFAR